MFTINLTHNDQRERKTKQQLENLLAEYDLSHWTFTYNIVIDSQSIPHSHPVLTLHTRHLDDDLLLLSTFLHEQIHWLLVQNRIETELAIAKLRPKYPIIPVGFPQGARDEYSSYLHLVVNYLEYVALQGLVGDAAALKIIEFWSTDHYTGIYQLVLRDLKEIGGIVDRYIPCKIL